MEEQLKVQMKKAFFDIVDQADEEYLKVLTQEVTDRLCALVPNRKDIHKEIKKDTQKIDHTTIPNILKLTKRMQAPIYDPVIDNWKREQNISDFIFTIHEHIDKIERDIQKERNKRKSSNGVVPDNISSGQ